MLGRRILTRGRKRARERMDAECTITRTIVGELDRDTGKKPPAQIVEVYAGACRIKQASAVGRKVNAAGQLVVVASPELRLPADTVGVQPGDEVTVTACVSRPALAGRRYTVREPFEGAQTTDLRYRIEVVDGR